MPLSSDEHLHLDVAQGFVELGMFLEANDALDDIDPVCRHLPEVLAVRVRVYQPLERWDLMEVVAKRMVQGDPDDAGWWVLWAYATRMCPRLNRLRKSCVLTLQRMEKGYKNENFGTPCAA